MFNPSRCIVVAGIVFVFLLSIMPAFAAVVEYELILAQQEVNITGNSAWAMTINGGIPGPTLRFKQGDTARIIIHNEMDVDTSIHWHGLLVPPDMDGVPNLSFRPIKAGTIFVYEFPLRQSGTYWYHSHTRLQEQSGVYGAIVIEPRHEHLRTDRDIVALFSDWTDENPHEVLRTLKRGSEWYAIEKGSGQSIFGAACLGMLRDYFNRELQRMPAMDIADVAYDRFLANGKPESAFPALPGETVRLRIIDGSATTYFYLEFAGGPMRIVSADGQDVQPVEQQRFLVGVAETYDVVIRVPAAGAYEFRATAHDGSGYASVWIGAGQRHPTPDIPRPNLYHSMGHTSPKQMLSLTPAGAMGMPDAGVAAGLFDKPGMMDMGGAHGMEGMDHGPAGDGMDMKEMNHSSKEHTARRSREAETRMEHAPSATGRMHPEEDHTPTPGPDSGFGKTYDAGFRFLAADVSASPQLAIDGMDPERPWPIYDRLRSINPTAFDPNKPVREIRLTLDGDMERYVWFLNNKPLSESDAIRIRGGEVVRFIMINRTMMHHPMHLHGHFFRVINGQDDHAPLKHTVNVAPMSTTVIEFDANEVGDWFFHCHLLYHMKSGMARVIHNEDLNLLPALAAIRPNIYKESWYFWGEADILSNMTEGFLTLSDTRNILTADWEIGWQGEDDTEWEGILSWSRYVNRFFSVFAGANLMEKDDLEKTRGVLGVHYLLPLNIESRVWVDTDGGARINFDKAFELTPRLMVTGEAQYDSHDQWEGSADLVYTVYKNFSFRVRWNSDYSWGGGVTVRF